MKVGFIGIGTMGASMALNVRKAGYDVVVNDMREAAAAPATTPEHSPLLAAVVMVAMAAMVQMVVLAATSALMPCPITLSIV